MRDRRHWRAVAAAVCVCAATSGSAEAQTCEQRWLASAGLPGTDNRVEAAIEFDFDGAGPRPAELVIGGWFLAAGDVAAPGAARWDGARWWPLGSAGNYGAFTLWDADGAGPEGARLVGARTLAVSPEQTIRQVVVWDGWDWQPLGDQFSGPDGMVVQCLAAFDQDGAGPLPPRLFAGGWGQGAAFRGAVAQWDGERWTAVGGGVSHQYTPAVYAMTGFDPDGAGPEPERLVVAGIFAAAGGVPASGIASWDGVAWRPLGAGLWRPGQAGYGWSLTVLDEDGPGPRGPELFVGGLFDLAGGQPAESVAAWDGAAWRGLRGLGPSAQVRSLAAFDADGAGGAPARLIAAGSIAAAGPPALRGVAAWDGANWAGLGEGIDPSGALVVARYRPPGIAGERLVAAGNFTSGGGAGARNVAVLDGQAWGSLGAGFNSTVRALASFDADGAGPQPSRLVAAGEFVRTPDGASGNVAWADGGVWSSVGAGWGYRVLALATWDSDGPGPLGERLIAGGSGSGGPIGQWDGAEWRPMGSQLVWDVRAILAADPDGPGPLGPELYIGGQGWPARVQRWGGTEWQDLGDGFTTWTPHVYPSINALVMFDADGAGPGPGELYAGGLFDSFGPPASLPPVARWDGAAWRPVGAGLSGTCHALMPFDPDGAGPRPLTLIAAGALYLAASADCGAAAWDGTSWAPLPLAWGSRVYALASFDADGAGPGLPVLAMSGMGPMASTGGGRGAVGAWDDSTVEPLGSGLGGTYLGPRGHALHVREESGLPRLYVGGQFGLAGGAAAGFLAEWGCAPPPPCYANCDGSVVPPVLSVADFVCFMNRFAAGDLYANCDGSSTPPVLTVGDFVCFLNRFAAGCP